MKKNRFIDFIWKLICLGVFAAMLVVLEDADFITWVISIAVIFFILRGIYRSWFYKKIYGVEWNEKMELPQDNKYNSHVPLQPAQKKEFIDNEYVPYDYDEDGRSYEEHIENSPYNHENNHKP